MNKVFRQGTSYIILCAKHDSLRKLKSLMEYVWPTTMKCTICGRYGKICH